MTIILIVLNMLLLALNLLCSYPDVDENVKDCKVKDNCGSIVSSIFGSFKCVCGSWTLCALSSNYCITSQKTKSPYMFEDKEYGSIYYGFWRLRNQKFIDSLDAYDIRRLPYIYKKGCSKYKKYGFEYDTDETESLIIMICSYNCPYLKEILSKLRVEHEKIVKPLKSKEYEIMDILYQGEIQNYKYIDRNDYDVSIVTKRCSINDCNSILIQYRTCKRNKVWIDKEFPSIGNSYRLPSNYRWIDQKYLYKRFHTKGGHVICDQCYLKH